MADRTYHDTMTDVVAEAVAEVQADVKTLVEEFWPQLIELKKPAERLAWYQTIDWNALRETSDLFWAKLSADANRLMGREENRIADAAAAYEKQAFEQEHAFRDETQPFGQMETAVEPYVLGQQTPMPLGRVGT